MYSQWTIVTTLLLLTLCSVTRVASMRTQFVVMLDQTQYCDQCSDGDQSCHGDNVTGAEQVTQGILWSLETLTSRNIISNDTIGVEIVDTCSDEETAAWRLLTTLGRLASSGTVTMTNPPHLILASHLNTNLSQSLVSASPGLDMTVVNPTSSPSLVQAAAQLVSRLGWSQTFLVSASQQMTHQLESSLAREGVCVLATAALPSDHDTKDAVTMLLSAVADTGVNRIIVTGNGEDIVRLVSNVFQLNLNMSIVAVPWDGSIAELPGSDSEAVRLTQLLPGHYDMPQLMREHTSEWSSEHLSVWPVVRAVYGAIVLGQASVDDNTAKTGLQLTKETVSFRVETADLRLKQWKTVGLWEEGEVRWTQETLATGLDMLVSDGVSGAGCYDCHCVNTGVSGQLQWRHSTWVTVIVSIAGVAMVMGVAMLVYMCSQCGQVLEGSQVTSTLLLLATLTTLVSVIPWTLLPTPTLCQLRSLIPGTVSTLVLAIMVSRSLLLATSDTDGLPGHASGCLQSVLALLMLSVQAGVTTVTMVLSWSQHTGVNIVSRDQLLTTVQCTEDPVTRMILLVWPAVLLLTQLLLSPFIWRSRRNYREGVLFSVGSWGLVIVTVGWTCAELFVEHLDEVSTAAGLISGACIILLVIFIPKVYMINKWGSGCEISLHLPATATSTLHTDTIDYVRGTDIYNDSSSMLYDNNPGNRRGLTHILAQYQKSSTLLSSDTSPATLQLLSRAPHNNSTYKLDSNTEPDPNISWEPFTGTGQRRQSVTSDHPMVGDNGVSSIFASNLAGYGYYNGYNSPLQSSNAKPVPSTKL